MSRSSWLTAESTATIAWAPDVVARLLYQYSCKRGEILSMVRWAFSPAPEATRAADAAAARQAAREDALSAHLLEAGRLPREGGEELVLAWCARVGAGAAFGMLAEAAHRGRSGWGSGGGGWWHGLWA